MHFDSIRVKTNRTPSGFMLFRVDEWINVREFGAIGDGNLHPLSERYSTLSEALEVYPHATSLNDQIDWCAIQAAYNKAKLYGGAKIIKPKGNYQINRTLNVPSNVLSKGDGVGITKILATDNFNANSHTALIRNDDWQNGNKNIRFEDFETDVRKQNQSTSYQFANIYLENVEKCHAKKIKVVGSRDGGEHGYYPYGTPVGNCVFLFRRAKGCSLTYSDVSYGDYDNIGLYEECEDNDISHNTIEYNGVDSWRTDITWRGAGIQVTGYLGHSFCKRNKITHNTIKHNYFQINGNYISNKGIISHSGEGCIITDNVIYDVSGGGIVIFPHPELFDTQAFLKGSLIEKNEIETMRYIEWQERNPNSALFIGGISWNTNKWQPIQDVVIVGNRIMDIPGSGMDILAVDDFIIEGNVMKNLNTTVGDVGAVVLESVRNGSFGSNTIVNSNNTPLLIKDCPNAWAPVSDKISVDGNVLVNTLGISNMSSGTNVTLGTNHEW